VISEVEIFMSTIHYPDVCQGKPRHIDAGQAKVGCSAYGKKLEQRGSREGTFRKEEIP
jgi:hypothetical protein